MLTDLIKRVLVEYQDQIATEFGKSPFMDLVNHELPQIIRDQANISEKYRVYGSCGTGAWAETPWVAILDKAITNSTRNGYYIVFLFDTKQTTLYLCLAVGWTQFQENFSLDEARDRIKNYSNYFADKLSTIPEGFTSGPIHLSAEHQLSKGYEIGEIVSKSYSMEELDAERMLQDTKNLIDTYGELSNIAGDNILNIDYLKILKDENISSSEQKINQATLLSDPEMALERIREIVSNEPPNKREVLLKQTVRNRKIALFVKLRASYICEVCGTKPFIQKNGQPYAEADHIVPLGGDTKGLDSPDNMRCLCAQCHAILTHGSDEEKRKLLG